MAERYRQQFTLEAINSPDVTATTRRAAAKVAAQSVIDAGHCDEPGECPTCRAEMVTFAAMFGLIELPKGQRRRRDRTP